MLNITLLKGKRGISTVADYYKESNGGEHEASEYYQNGKSNNCKAYNGDKFGIDENTDVEEALVRYSSNKRIGYDLTYSASKSVSISKYILMDNRISEAWDKAVERIVSEVNSRVYTRKKEGSTQKHRKAEGLFLAFQHDLSREKDPQLHTHIILTGKVKRDDGKYTALSGERIYKDKTLIDFIGNYELAYQLQQRGIKVRFEKGNLEVSGISGRVKGIFSKRRRQILQTLKEEYGITETEVHRNLANYTARATRRGKEKVGQEELDGFWEQQLKEIGYTRKNMIREYNEANEDFVRNKKRIDKGEERELLKITLASLHENYSLIDETTLQKEYLKRIFVKVNEENIELPSCRLLMRRFKENIQELKKEGYLKQRTLTLGTTTIEDNYFYTSEQEFYERQNVLYAQNLAKKKYSVKVDKSEIDMEIKGLRGTKGFQLVEGQSETIYKTFDPESSILMVEGNAGVWKTASLEVIKNVAGKKGIKVIGLAPTGKVEKKLGKILGKARTIDSFLLKLGRGEIDKRNYQNLLIILDKAGMVSARKSYKLLEFAKQTNSKIVLIGDTKQFQSIEAGAVLRDLKNAEIPYHRLSNIRRQKDTGYLIIAKALSKKDFGTAYGKILQTGMIEDFQTEDLAVSQLIEDYDRDTLIVVSDSKAKDILNRKIRERLGIKDDISLTAEVPKNVQKKNLVKVDQYEKGDIIYFKSHKRGVVIGTDAGRSAVLVRTTTKKRGEEVKEVKVPELQKQVNSIAQKKEIGLAVGDKVITLKNSKRFNVKNGELFEVAEVDRKNNRIKVANKGKGVWIDLNEYRSIDHAYVITAYESQGITVDRVKFYAKDRANYNEFYAAVTRGKQKVEIYTADAVQLLYMAQQPAEEVSSIVEDTGQFSRSKIAEKYIDCLIERGDIERAKKYLKYIDSLEVKKQILKRMENFGKETEHNLHFRKISRATQRESDESKEAEKSIKKKLPEDNKFLSSYENSKKGETKKQDREHQQAKKEEEDLGPDFGL